MLAIIILAKAMCVYSTNTYNLFPFALESSDKDSVMVTM